MAEYKNFLFGMIDAKHNVEDLYSLGVVAFIVKTKLLQADCFAKRVYNAYISDNKNDLKQIECDYHRYERFAIPAKHGLNGEKYEYAQTNPVKLFCEKIKELHNPRNANLVRNLAMLCFLHEYSYILDTGIFMYGCKDIQENKYFKFEKEALGYVKSKPFLGDAVMVMRHPYVLHDDKSKYIKKIMEQNFSLVQDIDYKKSIKPILNKFIDYNNSPKTSEISLFDFNKQIQR